MPTLGEVWKKNQYEKIEREAEEKKEKLMNANLGNSGATANKIDAIDKETALKKKDVDEVLENMGPSKDKPYIKHGLF
jgi:uncharacterized iron-regulated protein